MPRVPFNPKLGRIKTDGLEPCDRAFMARYSVKPEAESDDSVGVFPLTAEPQTITVGFEHPDVARNLKIKGTVAQMTGDVKITGTDMSGTTFNETIALNATATTSVAGDYAFYSISKIELPAQYTTPVKQKATVKVSAITKAGEPVLKFESAATGNDPINIAVVLVAADVESAAACATALAKALNANPVFSSAWGATASGDTLELEALVPDEQDASVDLTVDDADETGLTLGSINVSATVGVAPDKVKIGLGKRIGIPYRLKYKEQVVVKMTGGAADGGTIVSDDEDLYKNVLPSNKTINGTNVVDLYIIV